MPAVKLTYQVVVAGANSRICPATMVQRWVKTAAATLHLPAGIINVAFVSPAVSQSYNRRYRRRDRPTNILSFHYQPPADGVIGELLLCPAVIRREIEPVQRRQYIKFLLQHGCIHLLGLDHQTPAQNRRWKKYESLLKK